MYTYRLSGNAVVIIDSLFIETMSLDVPGLKKAVANVRAGRTTYATESTYLSQLNKYKGALAYAEEHGLA